MDDKKRPIGAVGEELRRTLTETSRIASGRRDLDTYVIDALKGNISKINQTTNKLAEGEIPRIKRIAEYYQIDIQPIDGEDLKIYYNKLIDAIARKQWEIYVNNEKWKSGVEGYQEHPIKLRAFDMENIQNHMGGPRVDPNTLEGWEGLERLRRLPPPSTGKPLTEDVISDLRDQFLSWMKSQGRGNLVKKRGYYDPDKINVRTREKIYRLFILLFTEFSGIPGDIGSPKNILALTLLLSYGSKFFEGIIKGLTEMLKTESLNRHAIDPHAGIPSISKNFDLSATQYVRVKADVQQLLSESTAKISKHLESTQSPESTESNAYFHSLISPFSLEIISPDSIAPLSDQLTSILEWGVVVPGKASKSTSKSPTLLEEHDAVERGIGFSTTAPMKIAFEKSGEEPVDSGPFALLKNEIELDIGREYLVNLLGMLNTDGLSDKLIDLFVLFSILQNQHKMKIINSLGEISPRRLQTSEGRKGRPMPKINSDEFILGFLGINYDSNAYKTIQAHLKGPEKNKRKYEYNTKIWGLYLNGDPEIAIEWLNENIDGFREAHEKDKAEKMDEMDEKTDLWYRNDPNSPWIPVSPAVFFDTSEYGYKTPEEIYRALFPSQAADSRIKRLRTGDWWPDSVKVQEEKSDNEVKMEEPRAAFSKKKKKKKKKKKPIQTKKQKKPSKRETKAQRSRRLRKQRESRKRKQKKKEKKSKKKNRTNRKKNDRTIRIGDSVEIHYN
jgi:hypothetical protein